MNTPSFFDGYEGLLRVLISAPILYVMVILFIRISGKRSTSQMNNFDWVVTVALGSLMGSGILLRDVTLAEAGLAIGLLLLLQWLLTKAMVMFPFVGRTVRATPTVLYHNDAYITQAMRRERVTEYEMLSALREQGVADLAEVQSIILEADAAMSVLLKSDRTIQKPAVQDVQGLNAASLR
tara:strand:+ start:2404 stop:2946 length:543 start_codon:yes stop_codon:yes gene_type:complete